MIGPYSKTIMAALSAIFAAILPGLITDTPLGISGVVNIAILALGAIQVLNTANTPEWAFAKGIAAAVSAAGVVFISVYTDGTVNAAEWVQVITALVIGIGGVYGLANSRTAPRETI